jgi:HEAT repeat protein
VLSFVNSGFLQRCDPSACGGLALETPVALAQLDQGPLALQLLEAALDALRDVLPFFFAFAERDLVRALSEVWRIAPDAFDLLLSDASPFVQALGLAALSNVQGRASRETLLRHIGPDEHVLVRRLALEGLSQWAIPDDVIIFAQVLTNPDRRTRAAAFSALARVGDGRALGPLREALGAEKLAIQLEAAGASLVFANRIVSLNEAVMYSQVR